MRAKIQFNPVKYKCTAPKNCKENNKQTSSYLIQRVVGGDGDGVSVHHQSLPQQCEQAVCVHDLHLPPARWGETRTACQSTHHFMTV